jgi:ABC-2 type transport system ATP-binding protein
MHLPGRWRGRRGRRLAVLAAAAAAIVVAGTAAAAVTSAPAPVTARNLTISVTDGPQGNQRVRLDATFFTPAGSARVPAILLAHGFGETKNAVRPEAEQLARAGFAVLTWSARGFGRSTGEIALDSPDYEVKDVEQLVSWLARQPRVRLDHPGDPRVGITGASYGGAMALLAAAYDHRIDAVVPVSTWNNLATALFPNAAGGGPAGGVFKRQWAGLLFGQGVTGGRRAAVTSPCGRFLPRICTIYQQAATLGHATPQAVSTLLRSSPASVARRLDAPTLLIQGEHDSLFGLDQADATYQALRRNGAPAAMVWFAGGHDGGNQETSRLDTLTTDWFERWLTPAHPVPAPARPGAGAGSGSGVRAGAGRGAAGAGSTGGQPGFAVSRNLRFDASSGEAQLAVATAGRYPGLNGTERTLVRLAGPPQPVINPPGGAPPSFSTLPGVGGLPGLAIDMPGQTAAFTSAALAHPVQVTGTPVVRIRVSGAAQVTLFAELYDVDQAGNAALPFSLAAPLRVTVPRGRSGQDATVRLPAIDYQFAAGHRLRLVLTTTDFGYATSPDPAIYRVSLAGPGVRLPADSALVVSSSGLPWWTWGAPLAAVLAAGLLLGVRRRTDRRPGRPRSAEPRPDLAGVPLDISGLTKRFKDGHLAVDNLSLRVERQQILGLLGPNGAGKTTTLRALMGLITPDSGTITIFGREVHAGSPALSRLGAFVEGPGFLPHLSGRANLELYWRSTGRPAGGAHLAEVLEIAGLGAAADKTVRTYSRGMSQRLAIAQAMLGLPDLLVLDEPMNGLDPPQIRQMREVLTQYAAAGRTVILSSHMLAEVELTCTDVVVMHLGRRIAAGSVSEIGGDGGAVVIGTPDPGRAREVLAAMAGFDRVESHPDGVLLHLDGEPASAAVAALVGAGLAVDRVVPHRRLEDAFLALIAGGASQPGLGDPGLGDPGPGDPGPGDPGPGRPDGLAGLAAASPERTP